MRHDADGPVEASRARAVADVAGVDDQADRMLEHEGRKREVLGTRLPQRWDPLVEDAVTEEAADDAVLALPASSSSTTSSCIISSPE